MIGRQIILTLIATLGLVAVVLSAGLLPLNSTARALPTAGTDILNVSGSTSIISVLGSETIALTGTVTIERSDPQIQGGVEVVDTEIVAMDLTGTSVTGPITVVESATLVSSGEIRSLQPPPDDFPASSFFDAFIEVAVPASPSEPLILHNEEPFRLVPTSGGSEVPLTAWPPTGVTYQDEPEPCIPLLPVLPAHVCVTSLSILLGEVKATPTNPPTPTNTPTPTVTPTPCPTGKVPADGGCGTPTATPITDLVIFPDNLPAPLPIPDATAAGVSDTIVVTDPRTIKNLDVTLDITHTWVGDLIVTLTHEETGTSATLIHRPGVPATTFGCSGNDIDATLDDEASLPAEDECAISMPTISGSFTPNSPLSVFDGESPAGTWTLRISDNAGADTGSLNGWSLMAVLSDAMSTPTPTPKDPDGDTDGDTIVNSIDEDDDADGCLDVQEALPNQSAGGRRNPHIFWDFFDVPTASGRDRRVDGFDIGAVVLRFGTFVVPPPTKEEAFAQALTPPPDLTSYHPAFDRESPVPGANVWNVRAPDGRTDGFDIGFIVAQFGHTCA